MSDAILQPFLMMTCQCGTEKFLKQEILERYHDFRFAYSRPGFVTFKVSEAWGKKTKIKVDSIFSRYCGLSLGRVQGVDQHILAEKVWELAASRTIDRIHLFPRDQAVPGEQGYEPGLTAECFDAHRLLLEKKPPHLRLGMASDCPDIAGEKHEQILDVIMISPDEWWVGHHQIFDWRSAQPGGLFAIKPPFDAISRAYLKFEEGLRWSGMPIRCGSRVLDIGAAPGGASQALLTRGAQVIGVDPALIHPTILNYPGFCYLRSRINQTKRRHFRKVHWIVTDMNVAPNYTLDVLEELVTSNQMNIRGILFTLKLVKWELIADIPYYIARIKSWGFRDLMVKQLQFNRQEIMVAARNIV